MTKSFKEYDQDSDEGSDFFVEMDEIGITDTDDNFEVDLDVVPNLPPANREDDDEVLNEEDDDLGDEDEVVRAIKAEKSKPRDHPPTITSEDFIVDISLHPAKNLIALGNFVGDILLYEYNNDETKLVNTFECHLRACRDIEFDSDGTTLYSTAKERSIMATDVETGNLMRCYEKAHDVPVYRLVPLDQHTIATGDDDGTLKLWDFRKRDAVFSIKLGHDHITDMITTDAQKYLACSAGDGVLTAFDMRARKIYAKSDEYDAELTCMGLFRSDTKLLVAASTGKLYLFNWKEFGLHSDEYMGQKHAIQCMVPITQNIVVTSGEDGILRAAHMFPQRQLGIVGQHRMPVDNLDISHDGQYIASCSHDYDVKFWNISYFESIESVINVTEKQNKRRDLSNNLPSSSIKNASDFFSGLA